MISDFLVALRKRVWVRRMAMAIAAQREALQEPFSLSVAPQARSRRALVPTTPNVSTSRRGAALRSTRTVVEASAFKSTAPQNPFSLSVAPQGRSRRAPDLTAAHVSTSRRCAALRSTRTVVEASAFKSTSPQNPFPLSVAPQGRSRRARHLTLTLALALLAIASTSATAQSQDQRIPRHALDVSPKTATAKAPAPHCLIQDNNTGNTLPDGAHDDALFKLLSAQPRCPQNALLFRDLVQQNKLALHTTMVANRGFHNPLPQGSFSFFEGITGNYGGQKLDLGDWFFGHFTAASIDNTALTSTLSPQQAATPDNLLLETFVWDTRKHAFNFYEIRGSGQGGVWFYRGDSYDIQADIANLDRAYDPGQPIFMGPAGDNGMTPRLRCSGCHMNGGPIMKELAFPHDSWWITQRPLDLGALRIAPEFVPILGNVVSAEEFSKWVKAGDEKMLSDAEYNKKRSTLSLQEQLRPIFCEQEVNLDSDTEPFGGSATTIKAPVGAFIDQRLAGDVPFITIDKALYTNALNTFKSQFTDYQSGSFANSVQPINQIDADHAFEVPVKSHSDMLLAQKMIAAGLVDEKFVYDVISVDMTRPMFSAQRCGLLQLVPGGAPGPDWTLQFQQNLANAKNPAAAELLAHRKDASHTPAWHKSQAKALLTKIQSQAAVQRDVNGYVRLLTQRRIAVYQAQISQHPQGQIFEPGFRLIFPTMTLFQKNQQQIAYGGVPGQYWLNPTTGVVELQP